jgi:hypothetical protein
MEWLLWGVGCGLIWYAVAQRLQRRDDYDADLEAAEDQKRVALLWGYGTEDEKIGFHFSRQAP